MGLPIILSVINIEIKALYLSDNMPIPSEGYEIVQLKDLGYTSLWIEYKIITS